MKVRTTKSIATLVGLGLSLFSCQKKESAKTIATSDEAVIEDLDPDTGKSNVPDDQLAFTGTLNLVPPKNNPGGPNLTSFALNQTDYDKAFQNAYVQDSSTETIKTVGGIVCFLGATRFWDYLNKGAYIALVDEKKCFGGPKNKRKSFS